MGSATSIPAAAPSVVSSAAAATTALKAHTHHDHPLILRFTPGVKIALMVIVAVSLLGTVGAVPVAVHMLLITCATIYVGSHLALKCWKVEGGTEETAHEYGGEQMQTRDAMMFPLIGSCVLFSLYCVYKFLPASMVNLVIKLYFFLFGCVVLSQKLAQVLSGTLPAPLVHSLLAREYTVPNPLYAVEVLGDKLAPLGDRVGQLVSRAEQAAMPLLSRVPGLGYDAASMAKAASDAEASAAAAASAGPVSPASFWTRASSLDLLSLALGVSVSLVYVLTGSWLASNLFGIAFSVQGIELLSLGSFVNGAILLSGLFFYDIFWVFGTEVMVTVAKSFDAPIKLLFPQFGFEADSRPSMLGLGDIVIPGIFIALLLRYDIWRNIQRIRAKANKEQHTFSKDEEHELDCLYCHVRVHRATVTSTYFTTNLLAYVGGLLTTVLVMYAFNAAQPALLYLVPACLGASMGLAVIRGDFATLWAYTENEEDKATAAAAAVEAKKVAAAAGAAGSGEGEQAAKAAAASEFSAGVVAEATEAEAESSVTAEDGVPAKRPGKSSSSKKKGSSKKKKSARAE